MTTTAVLGIGYWGKNLLRNLTQISDVTHCCHTGDSENNRWLQSNYPDIEVLTDPRAVFQSEDIDAVAIATPIDTHYDLTRQALESGKHVFVEKPLAETADEAQELRDLAEQRELVLFVGYIFVYHPLLQYVYSRSETQAVDYARFSWRKLGAFDEQLTLDVVSHPVSIACHLWGTEPDNVSVEAPIDTTGSPDLLSATLSFPNGGQFEIEVNRLSPESDKSLLVSFDDETITWIESELSRFDEREQKYEVIQTSDEEPLYAETSSFINTVEGGESPPTDGQFGATVSSVLETISSEITHR